MKTLKIQITGASIDRLWYADKIGQSFTVHPLPENDLFAFELAPGQPADSMQSGSIYANDCVVLAEYTHTIMFRSKTKVGESVTVLAEVSDDGDAVFTDEPIAESSELTEIKDEGDRPILPDRFYTTPIGKLLHEYSVVTFTRIAQ